MPVVPGLSSACRSERNSSFTSFESKSKYTLRLESGLFGSVSGLPPMLSDVVGRVVPDVVGGGVVPVEGWAVERSSICALVVSLAH